jgi:hypothetical protein
MRFDEKRLIRDIVQLYSELSDGVTSRART